MAVSKRKLSLLQAPRALSDDESVLSVPHVAGYVNRFVVGDAIEVMGRMSQEIVDLTVSGDKAWRGCGLGCGR